MTTFYVATLARYVLVEAANETEARQLGAAALHELYADLRAKLGRDVPIEIRTVRLATSDEIDLCRWHHRMLAAERKSITGLPRPGDRIRLLVMRDDPDPIPTGTLGTVVSCYRHGDGGNAWHQIDVAWDNGRTLMLVFPPDQFEIIKRAAPDKS
jgi:hypothetical protein